MAVLDRYQNDLRAKGFRFLDLPTGMLSLDFAVPSWRADTFY